MSVLIKCIYCQGSHGSALEVRACATTIGHINKPAVDDAPDFFPVETRQEPSEAQLGFAHMLLREREPFGAVADVEQTNSAEAAHEYVSGMSKTSISEFIGRMKRQPKRVIPAHRPQSVHVDEGMYRFDGTVYKVQVAHHGSGHLYAKRLIMPDRSNPLSKGQFVMEPGVISTLRPEHKMSLDEAKEFGKLYGFCVRCGRILTDEGSIAAGIGPICAGKEGWA